MLKFKTWKAVPIALMAISLLSSCGKKTFQKLEYSSTAIAGQYIYIKPKLDLVIFQDNSDSIANAMGQLKPQLASFLAALDTNWEYRVVVLPLLSQQSISSKVVIATDCTGVPTECYSPSRVGEFNGLYGDRGWITSRNSSVGNTDLGFQNMNYNINNMLGSGFHRSDASLVMMIISNNNDHTGVDYTLRPDGATTNTVNDNGPNSIASFNAYKNYFLNLKANNQLNKLYSVVATQAYSDCWGGGYTWAGTRYMMMSSALSTASYNLCDNGLSGVLGGIRGDLVTVVQTIEFNYVVLPEEPTPSSISISKNGTALPQSAVNGWEYVGYRSNQPTSFAPVSGNIKSGYMIKLNGSATFKGTDTIGLNYTKL